MHSLIKEVLLKFDEKNCYETPSNFNYKDLQSKVINLTKDLESILKTRLRIDNHSQDSSFYCDIIIPVELVINPQTNLFYSIRISNFGNLATFTFDDSYSEDIKATFYEILKRHCFIYVSSEDLDEEYDGNFEEFKKILGDVKPSWRLRYFDYL